MQLTQDTNLRADLVKEVIVNTALKLRDRLGYEATIDFLVDAAIPPDVIKRALHGGPVRQRGANVAAAPATTCLGDTCGPQPKRSQ